MCIRDSRRGIAAYVCWLLAYSANGSRHFLSEPDGSDLSVDCLLYTSDAADERSSVDLGGRRIIKKKKIQDPIGHRAHN